MPVVVPPNPSPRRGWSGWWAQLPPQPPGGCPEWHLPPLPEGCPCQKGWSGPQPLRDRAQPGMVLAPPCSRGPPSQRGWVLTLTLTLPLVPFLGGGSRVAVPASASPLRGARGAGREAWARPPRPLALPLTLHPQAASGRKRQPQKDSRRQQRQQRNQRGGGGGGTTRRRTKRKGRKKRRRGESIARCCLTRALKPLNN